MKYYCPEINLKVEINNSLIEKLYRIGLQHYPKEYGGILIGHYSEDHKTCFIIETITSENSKSSRYLFQREIRGLTEKLIEFYNQEPPLIYIGEWHTHPDSTPTPSPTDSKAMTQIEQHEQVNITSPLLLILGVSKLNYSVGLYVQHQKKLYRYEQQ